MTQSIKPTVWVVDDDEDDQHFICSAFKTSQLSIPALSIRDGADLLPALVECDELPRLILLDINMPRKNGFETLEELRSSPEFAHLPVVMLTTSSAERDRERAFSLGANQFLTKPLRYEQLRSIVEELNQQWKLT